MSEGMPANAPPPRLQQPILRTAWRFVWKDKGNCIIGITGMPNTGKSHLAAKMAISWSGGKIELDKHIVYTVKELLDLTFSFIKIEGRQLTLDMLRNVDNMRGWLLEHIDDIEIKYNQVVVFDEAGTGIYVREFFSQDNKTISKILQVWRFIRMLVLIVIPADLRLADSTVSIFLNIEIVMKGIVKGEYARAVAYEYIDWDRSGKRNKPIKKRLKGCRWGGHIRVKPLPDEWERKYERLSRAHKLVVLAELGIDYKIKEEEKIGKTRNIWDDVKHCRDNPDKFKNEKGKWDTNMIITYLGVGYHKALTVRKILEKKDRDSSPIPKQKTTV